jgi:hypothetical protein
MERNDRDTAWTLRPSFFKPKVVKLGSGGGERERANLSNSVLVDKSIQPGNDQYNTNILK